jgi:hypothetical protein
VPDVDGLLADIQIGGNLRDAAAGHDQVEDLAAELWRVALGMRDGPPSYWDE